jgi:rubrerythrin
MKFDTVDKILNFAIENEEDAAQFYTDLAGKMDRPSMKEVFQSFAREEKGHKAKLISVKEEKRLLGIRKKDSGPQNRRQSG